MKDKIMLLLCALGLVSAPAAAEVEIPLFDHVTYYDGYLVGNIPEDAPDEGVHRLYTYMNTVKMTDSQLDMIGESLRLDVTIHAACDNYDRIGSVNLAFIPKGRDSYSVVYDDLVDPLRIEIARFITPFMDKNEEPTEVPYSFQIDNLSSVLRNKALREAYDIWVELEVFGVPYAAQNEIWGCQGCIDVFRGSLSLVTDDTPGGPDLSGRFVPVVTRRSDWRSDRGMNNYNTACTDRLGRTVKDFPFTLPEPVKSGRVVIIMSNHGAGTNGEEYVRRIHNARLDDAVMLEWKPGRETCEPYRIFNTQPNGIYGWNEKTPTQWQSFSNWCPGAPIPYRTFETGPLEAGEHVVNIEVFGAEFYNDDGYFPVSIYFQGDKEGAFISEPSDLDTTPSASLPSVVADDYTVDARVEGDCLTLTSHEGMTRVEMYDSEGRFVMGRDIEGATTAMVDVSTMARGVYVVAVTTPRRVEARKLAL